MGICSSSKSSQGNKQQIDIPQVTNKFKRDTQASFEMITKRSNLSPIDKKINGNIDSQRVDSRTKNRNQSSSSKFNNTIQTQPSCLISPLFETSASKKYSFIGDYQGNHQISILQNNKTGVLVQMENFIKNDQQNEKYNQLIFKMQLDHPNLLRIIEIHQDNKNYQVIYEHFNGNNLQELISTENKVSKKIVSQIIDQIISVIQYLHSKDLTHGNLTLRSLEYIQIENNIQIKLIDLKSLIIKEDNNLEIMKFSPPESVEQTNKYTIERDIWAIGIICITLRKGILPYNIPINSNVETIKTIIQDHNFSFHHKKDKVYKNFLESILVQQPKNRKCLAELQKHQFIINYKVNQLTKQQILFNNFLVQKPCVKLQQLLLIFFSQEFGLEEYLAAQKLFSEGDINKDVLLDYEEIIKLFEPFTKDQYKNDQIQTILKQLENEGKKSLDQTEFLSMVISRKSLLSQQNIEIAFQILSFNKKEIQLKGLKRHLQNESIDIKQEFSYLTDNSNTLNFQQFDQLMKIILQ